MIAGGPCDAGAAVIENIARLLPVRARKRADSGDTTISLSARRIQN